MNRARTTVARMNHFADRHCQRAGLASESSIVAAIAQFSPKRVDRQSTRWSRGSAGRLYLQDESRCKEP